MQYAITRRLSLVHFGLPQKFPCSRDALQPGAVRMNHVEIDELQVLPAAVCRNGSVRAAVGRERDPLAVGRPRRTEVAAVPRRQRLRPPRLQLQRPEMREAALRVLTNTSCLPSGENAA